MLWVVPLLSACPGDDGDDGGPAPLFPEDYDASYVEVRNCRGSGDHDLHNIRILVDPSGLAAYEGRAEPFPEGSVVMKEEYDFGDVSCSGEIVQWTVMRKLAEGSGEPTLGWQWQELDLDRRVVEEDGQRCIACHTGCGVPPDGYDGTCSIPP
ncbi:cytochrome P460 family protein [Paraliomyxa miuraensis]|uniref:cytochrome P460 family protein n=1 Tax=Paraliomyxa miuraensis TaxID=376150 RepID=UPI002250A53C|nr:cytochrome P460 family protein [Paraliomyxa miuraensis]MCX4241357.1 cytochrome P460 family protein [Paraliomyxa miuraensis]